MRERFEQVVWSVIMTLATMYLIISTIKHATKVYHLLTGTSV